MANICYKFAWDYYEKHGLSVIPCYISPNKEGKLVKGCCKGVRWSLYQEKRATIEELIKWYTVDIKNAQVGCVTGKVSGIFVLDLDKDHDQEKIKSLNLPQDSWLETTPSGGEHWYFSYPDEGMVRKRTDLFGEGSKVDIQGDNAIVVMSPTAWKDKSYKWIRSPEQYSLKQASSELLLLVCDKEGEKKKTDFNVIFNGIKEGDGRNNGAAQLIGMLLTWIPEEYWPTTCWMLIECWNERNKPPLSQQELLTTFKSVVSTRIKSRSLSNLNK